METSFIPLLFVFGIGCLFLGWLVRRYEKRRAIFANYVAPGRHDVPLNPQVVFVSGINKVGLCGKSRQTIIARCREGEPIYPVRQPDNPNDRNAIILYRADGTDIGYLPAAIAEEMAPRLDLGSPIAASFKFNEVMTTRRGRTILAPRIELIPHRLRRP